MEHDTILSEIGRFVENLSREHKLFSESFYRGYPNSPNLARYEVSDIFQQNPYDRAFMGLVEDYLEALIFVNLENTFVDKSIELLFRVKQLESVVNKIVLKHQLDTIHQGSVVIQKCLNDLLGARLIVDTDLSYDDILSYIETLHWAWRPYYRKDGDYRALHLYVKNNNRFFPWELQIWRKCDEIKNEKSHAEHVAKRRYIEWNEQYETLKKGG